jgi:hypothetical protein
MKEEENDKAARALQVADIWGKKYFGFILFRVVNACLSLSIGFPSRKKTSEFPVRFQWGDSSRREKDTR